jgi:hypothetical protein
MRAGLLEAPLQLAIVAENAQFELTADRLVAAFRRAGIITEGFVTGSPRKRYDRAMKLDLQISFLWIFATADPAAATGRFKQGFWLPALSSASWINLIFQTAAQASELHRRLSSPARR